MYSLLLMTAMAAGPDASSFGWRSASCSGCYGGCYSYGCWASCTGCCGGYASCCGGGCWSSYTGCCGGLFHGGLLSHRSCYGCCGGVYYSSCHGYGSCYGSCWGSCYGTGYGSSCWGSCYGSVTGPVYVTPGTSYAPAVTVPAVPMAPAPATTAPAPTPAPSSSYLPTAPARLTIELPASAKLFVDGQPTKGNGESRQFHTPPLSAGQSFYYEFRAEIEVAGKTTTEEKRVVVRAGDNLTESFPRLIAAAKGEKAELAAK